MSVQEMVAIDHRLLELERRQSVQTALLDELRRMVEQLGRQSNGGQRNDRR